MRNSYLLPSILSILNYLENWKVQDLEKVQGWNRSGRYLGTLSRNLIGVEGF